MLGLANAFELSLYFVRVFRPAVSAKENFALQHRVPNCTEHFAIAFDGIRIGWSTIFGQLARNMVSMTCLTSRFWNSSS